MSEDGKSRVVTGFAQSQYPYGTFQGVANYYPPSPQPPPQPVIGLPPPFPPPAYAHGYHTVTVTGYVVEGRPVREDRLPCCGLGMGWFLFISGFIFGGIPWYLGTFILLFVRTDYREKPGYVACTIASILAFIAVALGVTNGTLGYGG
ncbi:hypothetical protein CFOL_v3_09958 [Cephalotus follicularis]|uniref:60S ribosomal protein L18a-like protein n=1 Tax=Cephalotus follicularis TaxID=3775 RepID=A0A1Q3BES5_CEPFO|nr:hypothetical protein CFOL_v3_09958 [Cephalotus follicularis]